MDELFILRFYPHHCLSFIEYMCSHFLQIYYILRNLKKVLFKKRLYYIIFFLNLHSSGSFRTKKPLRKTVVMDLFPLFHSCQILFLCVRLRKTAHLWVTFTIKVSLNCCVSRHSFFSLLVGNEEIVGVIGFSAKKHQQHQPFGCFILLVLLPMY